MEEHASSPSPLETASALSAGVLRELQQRAQAALSASRDQAARLEADITCQLDEIAATLGEQIDAETQNASKNEQHQTEVVRLTEEFNKAQENWRSERQSLETEREEWKKRAEELEARHRSSQGEWQNQLLDFETRLQDQQNSWNVQRTEWTTVRTGIEHERDELRQKFELALQDVQRLRERVSELEHDLARRPSAEQADSTELVALRTSAMRFPGSSKSWNSGRQRNWIPMSNSSFRIFSGVLSWRSRMCASLKPRTRSSNRNWPRRVQNRPLRSTPAAWTGSRKNADYWPRSRTTTKIKTIPSGSKSV